MKKYFFMLLAACVVCNAVSAQVFIIERGSGTLTYDNIKSAVDALQDNDKLYLPPGTFSLSGYIWNGYDGSRNDYNTLVVNKKVSIYGNGYNDGSNSTVIKDGTFAIGKDADGSLITGIQFYYATLTLDNVSNCIVRRCRGDFNLCGTGNNIIISECVVEGGSQVSSSGWTSFDTRGSGLITSFDRCIFTYHINKIGTATIKNSLILDSGFYGFGGNNNFTNNVIIINKTVTNSEYNNIGGNNTFSHNLWVGGYHTTNTTCTFNGEIERVAYTATFVNGDGGDYHLKPASAGKNAGTDGTDVGIYGTTMPFKESRLPSIPHFSIKDIATETNAEGKLPVHIQIEAQDN